MPANPSPNPADSLLRLLEELEVLESHTTEGPWHFQPKDGPRECTLKRRHWEIGQRFPGGRGIALVFAPETDDEPTDANARLVVALRNALPELVSGVRELIKRNKALERQIIESDLDLEDEYDEDEQERLYREGDDGADYPYDPVNNPDGYR